MQLLLALAFACSSPSEAPPPRHPPVPHGHDDPHAAHSAEDHLQRAMVYRDRLRRQLGDAYDQPVPGLDEADPARGRALYEQHCARCHGAGGRGDGPDGRALEVPPADFSDPFHSHFFSDAARVHVIEHGMPGTAMPPFVGVLDRQQILDVYAYVRTYRPDASTEGAHPPPTPPTHDH